MILEEKVKDLVVIGEDTSKKARISGDKLAKLQYLLTKGLYKDPITAVIAEWTNNGIDSVVQAGKNPVETPVIVTIGVTPESKGQVVFRVQDEGVGLDDRDFEDICMNYLESTKESDNDTIGHFGIGMKSFLSLERSATFTCRKNGIERKYLVYEGPEFVNFDLIYERPTTEGNGVIAELTINGWIEKNLFVQKAQSKLAYYDTAVLIIDGRPTDNQIYRNELFQWASIVRHTTMHLCLKDVYYPIDWEALGINQIDISIALRLSLKDGLTPTPSRESYITNEKAKTLLLGKITEVADWFVKKYNDTVKNFKTFMDAIDYLGKFDLIVEVGGRKFMINPLTSFSNVTVATIKVDGITVRNPNDYKIRRADLLTGYSIVGYTTSTGVAKTKRISVSKDYHIFMNKKTTVLVGDDFKGNIKEFLRDKYGNNVMFLRDNGFKRELGKSKDYGEKGQMKIRTDTYRYILDLNTIKKEEWRKHIDEWNFVVSSIVATFKDETKVAESKEFADWLTDKRDRQKEERKLKGGPKAKGLGKQEGDVTLAYAYERYSKIHFGKKVYPISDLKKNQFLTVLVTDDDNVDLAKAIISCMKDREGVRFAYVGKKEIKKIPNHYQFINFKKFMSRDCKPFMRIASAIKFDELLTQYKEVKEYKNIVFSNVIKTFNKDAEILDEYVSNNFNYPYSMDKEFKNVIIDVADQYDLYDKELWDVYTRFKEGIQRYDFIHLIKVPYASNYELTRRYEKLVNQILLFRKKYYNDLPEGAKIVFEPETKTKENELV